jgi:hypothetical protein
VLVSVGTCCGTCAVSVADSVGRDVLVSVAASAAGSVATAVCVSTGLAGTDVLVGSRVAGGCGPAVTDVGLSGKAVSTRAGVFGWTTNGWLGLSVGRGVSFAELLDTRPVDGGCVTCALIGSLAWSAGTSVGLIWGGMSWTLGAGGLASIRRAGVTLALGRSGVEPGTGVATTTTGMGRTVA